MLAQATGMKTEDLNLEARIHKLIAELESIPSGIVDASNVAIELKSILARASDAQFEIRCRQADLI